MTQTMQKRILEHLIADLEADEYEVVLDQEMANTGQIRAVEDGNFTSPYVLSYSFQKNTCTFQHSKQHRNDPAHGFFANLSYDDEGKLRQGLERILWFLKGAKENG